MAAVESVVPARDAFVSDARRVASFCVTGAQGEPGAVCRGCCRWQTRMSPDGGGPMMAVREWGNVRRLHACVM